MLEVVKAAISCFMKKKKPIIFFDDQTFIKQKFGGISRYFATIIFLLNNQKRVKIYPLKYFSQNAHLFLNQTSKLNLVYTTKKFKGKARVIQFFSMWKNKLIQKKITQGNYDIFHPTYYDVDFLKFLPNGKPFVLTIHDMIHELYFDELLKKTHNETKQKQQLIPQATHIIAISEHTKKDILQLYPQLDSSNISVIYHGYSASTIVNKKLKNNTKQYFLFVGTRGYYKNFEWMLKTISEFLKEKKILLICAGGGNFNENEIELIIKNELAENVQFYDILNDEFLNNLYFNATCFIFPSFYEGFGLPILEAFANRCPVVLANASCFPEIAGDAALYFDVNNPDSLLEQLNIVLYNKSKIDILLNKASERLALFSWEKTAEQHTQIYEKVFNSKRN